MVTRKLDIKNKVGLHARPAALFAQQAQGFQSSVIVNFNGQSANAKSLLSILGLGIGNGAAVVLQVEGQDEDEALAALVRLVESNFGEE